MLIKKRLTNSFNRHLYLIIYWNDIKTNSSKLFLRYKQYYNNNDGNVN